MTGNKGSLGFIAPLLPMSMICCVVFLLFFVPEIDFLVKAVAIVVVIMLHAILYTGLKGR